MNDDRLPRVCFNDLIRRQSHIDNKLELNWVGAVNNLLETMGQPNLTELDPLDNMKIKYMLQKWENNILSKNIERICNSNYNPLYRCILSLSEKREQ